jgi:hypothetical protein
MQTATINNTNTQHHFIQRGRAICVRGEHVNIRSPAEIARWSRELGVSWAQLFLIIDRVGTSVRSIRNAVLNDTGTVWH